MEKTVNGPRNLLFPTVGIVRFIFVSNYKVFLTQFTICNVFISLFKPYKESTKKNVIKLFRFIEETQYCVLSIQNDPVKCQLSIDICSRMSINSRSRAPLKVNNMPHSNLIYFLNRFETLYKQLRDPRCVNYTRLFILEPRACLNPI